MLDATTVEKLETSFNKLAASKSKSLIKKYLTRKMFDALRQKKTTYLLRLMDFVQSGFAYHSNIGIHSPDPEADTVYADLFDPIIYKDYHRGFKKTDIHPPRDCADINSFGKLDEALLVASILGLEYPFNAYLTKAQYKLIEVKVTSALSELTEELKNNYYLLTGKSEKVQQQLIDDPYRFKEGEHFLKADNASRFWPSGRSIFYNKNKTFLDWCNEEDHLHHISMQPGANIKQICQRLVKYVQKKFPFSYDKKFGSLTNLGTSLRTCVHVKLPKLAAGKHDDIAEMIKTL